MDREFKKQIDLQKLIAKYGDIPVVQTLKGFVLNGRFVIDQVLSEGAFGKIYQGYDLAQKVNGIQKPVIIKLTKSHEMNDREFKSLIEINDFAQSTQEGSTFFAETYCKGKILIQDPTLKPTTQGKKVLAKESTIESQIWSYIVQEKLGKTMEHYLFERNEPFSEKTVLQIGIQLIDAFKMIHEAGYTFNDLKLDNVLIGDACELPNHEQSFHKIRLIDFGLCKKWHEADGSHIAMKTERIFQGNMIFASKNAFNYQTQSRRDDLISLCYFLLYLVDGDLSFLQNEQEDDQPCEWMQEEFNKIKTMKNSLTVEMLAESDEGKRLIPFISEVFSLGFEDTPDYDKLRFMLLKILLEINSVPNKKFDWNEHVQEQPDEQVYINKAYSPIMSEDVDMAEDINEISDGALDNNSGASKKSRSSKGSEQAMSNVNLNERMQVMQGYSFQHN